jgi:hypothetical protein
MKQMPHMGNWKIIIIFKLIFIWLEAAARELPLICQHPLSYSHQLEKTQHHKHWE